MKRFDRFIFDRQAFTLVEVLIVVVVIGILAAIVIPYFSDSSTHSRISALATTTRTIQTKVKERQTSTGTPPATIDPAWFGVSQLPTHPQNTFNISAVETVSIEGLFHPANKVLNSSAAGAFWYNAAEGAFCARVLALATPAETLAVYNLVNGSSETDLGASGGGGGGTEDAGGGTGGGTGGWGS